MKKTLVCAVALAAAMVAAAPVAAAPKLKPGKFTMRVTGEQLTTWKYVKQVAPSCDWPEFGDGRQYIDFHSVGKPKVTLKPVEGGVKLVFAKGEGLNIRADAELERNYRILYSQMSDCPPGSGPFGGEGPPPDEIGTATCAMDGELEAYVGKEIGEVENPSYPTGLPNTGKGDHLFFAADPLWTTSDSYHSLPAACDESGQYNADMTLTETQGEWAGAIVPAGTGIAVRKLLDPKRKRTTIELGRTVTYPNETQTWGGPPKTTGKTRMDAKFTFTRVGRR